jgi:murein endopeptidase
MRAGPTIAVAGLACAAVATAAVAAESPRAQPRLGGVTAERAQVGRTPALPRSCRVPASVLRARSLALGKPHRGRLVRGVALPEETADMFTWEFPTGMSPSPEWRRFGTERLVLTIRCVLAAHAAAWRATSRVGVGDLSLPRGGPFGRRYGGLGHSSHQNGLDADVLYPRVDLCECPPEDRSLVDRPRAQDLVDRFVAAGAEYVFVGRSLRLRGPRGVVVPWPHHDDHMHVRLRARSTY